MKTRLPQTRVLATDGQQRKTLAVTRSLARHGHLVAVGEHTSAAVSLYSRYCWRRITYPHPRKDPAALHRFLTSYIESNRIDALFPMDDDITDLVSLHSEHYRSRAKVVLAPPDAYEIGRDKLCTWELANARGIRAAVTESPGTKAEAVSAARKLCFPCVLKPRKSSGARGIEVIRDERSLEERFESLSVEYGPPLVQEYVPHGDKFDVCLLYDAAGAARVSFVQRELRHYPLRSGPSTLQESVRAPELVKAACRLLADSGWRSIAEVEFMIDPRDGRPVLMEINPRYWASVKCAMLSGIDFPLLSLEEAFDLKIPDTHDYQEGIRCRWLLPGDILHYLSNPNRMQMEPSFFSMDSRTYFDIIDWDDPGPILGVAAASLRYALDPELRRMVIRS